jgi:hypothetical protein
MYSLVFSWIPKIFVKKFIHIVFIHICIWEKQKYCDIQANSPINTQFSLTVSHRWHYICRIWAIWLSKKINHLVVKKFFWIPSPQILRPPLLPPKPAAPGKSPGDPRAQRPRGRKLRIGLVRPRTVGRGAVIHSVTEPPNYDGPHVESP